MIRLPPSAITLGSTDLKDFDIRQRQRRDLEAQTERTSSKEHNPLKMLLTIRTATNPTSYSDLGNGDDWKSQDPDSSSLSLADTEYPPFTNLAEDQEGYRSAGNPSSPENTLVISQPTSPFKTEFRSVGSGETPPQQPVIAASQQPSPFSMPPIFNFILQHVNHLIVPEHNSTFPDPQLPAAQELRSRILPRSPLPRYQNVSSSPEHRSTSSIISPVNYHIEHNNPGEFSGQPARRPARTFRHQTNSFSFDDSVRASAVYEQDRISSTSTTGSRPHPSPDLTLEEELRRASLANKSGHAAEIPFLPEIRRALPGGGDRSESEREHVFHWAKLPLPLPPPFSSISRSTSTAGSLPSVTDQSPGNPSASLVTDASRSPSSQLMDHTSHETAGSTEDIASSPAVSFIAT